MRDGGKMVYPGWWDGAHIPRVVGTYTRRVPSLIYTPRRVPSLIYTPKEAIYPGYTHPGRLYTRVIHHLGMGDLHVHHLGAECPPFSLRNEGNLCAESLLSFLRNVKDPLRTLGEETSLPGLYSRFTVGLVVYDSL